MSCEQLAILAISAMAKPSLMPRILESFFALARIVSLVFSLTQTTSGKPNLSMVAIQL